MARVKADIKPDLLVWARESAGFSIDEVAGKLKQDPDVIRSWEHGPDQPFMGQLRRLADIYKRSLSDFYLPERPKEWAIPHDFRRSPGEVALVYSPALRRQLRVAQERRDLAIALYEEVGQAVHEIAVRITERADPEAIGGQVRQLLDIDFQEQRRWGDGRSAYNAWRRRIEALGILVFQFTNVAPEEAWGFSIVDGILPVVGINRKLAPNGRTFTLLHELVHVLLGESSICDIDDLTPRGPQELQIEVFCNRVAAAALMPRPLFLAHDVIADHEKGKVTWDDHEIAALGRTFGVSREAAVRRLETFGLTTMAFYLRKREQYRREREERRKKELAASKEKPMKRNMPREAVSNLGRRFVGLILHNYEAERITLMDASNYLGVRAEKVRNVEELARAW
ncbi:MAG: ImmA/IrrE family metallo-endopeptidase [Proteobacteria bacterium]|nr:ImmA/IrrE family metallo-endopeptidase [Pseudomonadota bacterium]